MLFQCFKYVHAPGIWMLSPNQQPQYHPEQTDSSKQRKGRAPSHDYDQEGEGWCKYCWPNCLTSPYCAGLKCNSLVMGTAARPRAALSAKLITPRPRSMKIIIHPYGEMWARAAFIVYPYCYCGWQPKEVLE